MGNAKLAELVTVLCIKTYGRMIGRNKTPCCETTVFSTPALTDRPIGIADRLNKLVARSSSIAGVGFVDKIRTV